MFDRIKHWYDVGLWTAANVDKAEARGWITPEQAAEILAAPPDEGGAG
jgi:hypothetical protein